MMDAPAPHMHPTGLAGRMLIAAPSLDDERFERCVIFVCAHDADHAMGIIINRPLEDISLEALLDRVGVSPDTRGPTPADATVLQGGPVEPKRGFVLHSSDYDAAGATHQVTSQIALTATMDALAALAAPGAPAQAVLALGYAGWDGGQLEAEIASNAWFVCDADSALVFGSDHDEKWARALRSIGADPERLSGDFGQA